MATGAMHNLGHVLAYCGRLDEARALELRAIDAILQQGDPRLLGVARTYLAKIGLLSGDAATAEREARERGGCSCRSRPRSASRPSPSSRARCSPSVAPTRPSPSRGRRSRRSRPSG